MNRIVDLLALVGRYGTQGFAISIFLGLALPQFAAAARPLLGVTIFIFTMLTFARIDLDALRVLLRKPRPLALATGWLVIAPIGLCWIGLAVIGRENIDPGLVLGLAILAAAPPIMSAAAVAMLLGLQPTLLLTAVVLVTALSPLLSPLIAEWVAGAAVPLDLPILIKRLLLLIGGAFVAAAILRMTMGIERITRHKSAFDGVNVLMYFIFAIAAMDGVLAAAIATPGTVALFLAVAFVLSGLGFLMAWLLLRALPPADRFVLGYATGHRNMGLVVAALGAATPDTTFLFFALAQFPIYLMPQIVKPLVGRFRAPPGVAKA